MPWDGIFTSGTLFDFATIVESNDQLPVVYRKLAQGITQPGGFVAHISIPTAIQTKPITISLPKIHLSQTLVTASEETIVECAKFLSQEHFAIWVGFGARKATKEIRELAERTKAAVMCSPRGKGIFPEDHPLFVGVTGFAGHTSVLTYMQEYSPSHILVLGTRLGELTSSWNPVMIPSGRFLHVDIDPFIPGTAYPSAETFGIQSDIGLFVQGLLHKIPEHQSCTKLLSLPRPYQVVTSPYKDGLIRPEVLMNVIQRVIVEESNAVVMVEVGTSLAWGNHALRFTQPSRYRASTSFSSLGHFATGVVGASLTQNIKVVAIVGDGAMLMNSEVSTAVKYQIPAVWIILNDGGYNMCRQGSALQGYKDMDVEIPQADFVQIACAMGATGIRVEREADIQVALEKAISSTSPFVVDVIIDPTQPAPIETRIQNLISQAENN
jgi:acetolactate synthase-1/2/3 large subunit